MSAVSFLICDPSPSLQTFFQKVIAGYGFDAGALFFLAKPFGADDARKELTRAVDQLATTHPALVKQVQARDKEATQLWAANLQLPALPKFKPGDRVLYRGQPEVVHHVILRRGEMVVQLRDVSGLIEPSKIQMR